MLLKRDSKSGEVFEISSFLSTVAMELEARPNLEVALDHTLGASDWVNDRMKKLVLRQRITGSPGLREIGNLTPEMEQAVHLIETSVRERDEENRHRNLRHAMDLLLGQLRRSAEDFVGKVRMKVLMLYGVGVLVPLILAGLFPVWSVFGSGLGVVQIAILYCVGLPVLVHLLSERILSERPPVIRPPEVPLRVPLLRKLAFLLPPLVLSWMAVEVFGSNPLTVFFCLGTGTLFFSAFLISSYWSAFRRREEIAGVEADLPGALLEIGTLLVEGRALEDCLKTAAKGRKNRLGSALERVSSSALLGVGVSDSVGTLDLPAPVIGVLRTVALLARRGALSAGKSVLRMAEHLKRLEEVKHGIKRSLGELTGSMRAVALFFAPLTMGVMIRIHGFMAVEGTGLLSFSSLDSTALTLTTALYVLILAAQLMVFAVGLESGDDRVVKLVSIGIALPVALGVFAMSWVVSGSLLQFLAV